MSRDARASKPLILVLRALELLVEDAAVRVELDAVDVFDVREAAPSRHALVDRVG